MNEIAHFVGQVARPFAIITTSFSASWAAIVSGTVWLIYALASFGPTLWERIARIGGK